MRENKGNEWASDKLNCVQTDDNDDKIYSFLPLYKSFKIIINN